MIFANFLPILKIPLFVANGRSIKTSPVHHDEPFRVNVHKVNNMDKRFLVWTKKFKRIEDVPEYIAPEIMDKAKNRMRIKVANIMIVGTLITCLLVAISGRRARDAGDSVEKRNLDWHKEFNEKSMTKDKES